MNASANPLNARGLRPAAELAEGRPHGVRLRYIAGCRCGDCRQANSRYETFRAAARKAGDWNGIVAAAPARAHLALLSSAGVGRRVVCDVSGVADTVLTEIIAGRKAQIRARTERAILAVTVAAAADGAYIDAKPTWKLLDALIADGYSKTELARRLGYATHALQLKRTQVTVRNAYDVQRLYERLQMCDAGKTMALLAELSDEGFHRSRVRRLLETLAIDQGAEVPSLDVRRGRILLSTAKLVERLHAQLTGEVAK